MTDQHIPEKGKAENHEKRDESHRQAEPIHGTPIRPVSEIPGTEEALERLFRPGYLTHWADRSAVNGFCLAMGLVPLLVVLGFPLLRDVLIGHVIAGATLLFYSVLLLTFVGRLVLRTFVSWPALRAGDQAVRKDIRVQWTV